MSDPKKKPDLKKITKDNKKSENENQCPICLEQISNMCRTDPCSHEFCLQCLRHWSDGHNFCPVCRQVFDRILHNFRADNQFDSITVRNRQSRVRGSLFGQRDALRETLTRIRSRVDQDLSTMRQRIGEREEVRDRISQQLQRINSIDRQNNEEIDQTLNQIRNAINEINYQEFVEGVSRPGVPMPPNLFPRLLHLPWADNLSESLTVNQNGGTGSPSRRSVFSGPDSDSDTDSRILGFSGPRSVEWRIFSPTSVGTISVSSEDSDNGSVSSINSMVVSHSMPDLSDFEETSSTGSRNFSQFPNHNVLQDFNDLDNFQQIENRMDEFFENMAQRFHQNHGLNDNFGQRNDPVFASSSDWRQPGTSTNARMRQNQSSAANSIENTQMVRNSSNARHPFPLNNSILRRDMNLINQIRSSIQMLRNNSLISNQSSFESDSDSDSLNRFNF